MKKLLTVALWAFCLGSFAQQLFRNSATTNALPEVRALDITGTYGPITSLGKIEGTQLSVNNSSLWNLTTDGTDLHIAGFNIPLPIGFWFGLDDVFQVSAPTNGVAPPSLVRQPIGLFGSMMLSLVTNTVTIGASGTYYTLTNYSVARTNGFGANLAKGFLTNTVAGYYRVTVYASMIGGGSDTLEGETFLNETGREEISLFGSFDNPARVRTMSSTGILYIPANTGISFRLNNRSDTDNITVWRAAITVGTP